MEARSSLRGQPGSESFRSCTDSDAHRRRHRRRIGREGPDRHGRIRGSFKLAPAVVTETWTESFASSLLVQGLQVLILARPVGVDEDPIKSP